MKEQALTLIYITYSTGSFVTPGPLGHTKRLSKMDIGEDGFDLIDMLSADEIPEAYRDENIESIILLNGVKLKLFHAILKRKKGEGLEKMVNKFIPRQRIQVQCLQL